VVEARQIWSGDRTQLDTLWQRQWLVASAQQLNRRGLTSQTIARAVATKRLFAVHRGIYSAVPPELLTIKGRMAAAILLGGRGAALCDESAAWWLALQKEQRAVIHVAVRGARPSTKGVRWHRPALLSGDLTKYRRFPTTTPARTLLDLAVHATLYDLQQALAEAEYHFDLQADEIATRQGHPGSAKLQQAIARHIPALARTRSALERAFVRLLEKHRLKIPEINHPMGLATVDAIYHDERVAIELDGVKGHRGERRILRDHRRDLHRRADGYLPLRYHYSQITGEQDLVVADLIRAGIPHA
jgi:very-short-patch-repair endonuclease